MPVLLLDGVAPGIVGERPAPGPCEWCGVPLSREEIRPVYAAYHGERPAGADGVSVLTRLCQGCIDIYVAIGSGEIREMPGD